jgi:hypothetical protein
MFGYQGGESADTVARKAAYSEEALQRWTFLTTIDLSSIKNKEQLCSMIMIRSSVSEDKAREDVEGWMRGKTF